MCRSCHNQRPEVKERMKEYDQRPEVKERKKERMKEYNQRPEVKERNNKSYKRYHQRPEVKERMKEYDQRPEVKERKTSTANANVKQAADTYIKSLIRKESKRMLKSPDIPKNIIELKRHALILKRAITEQQDEQHSTTDV